MSDRQRFNLHLPGLLKVLAEHLYTSKKVGIRELIQNAHDSCVRRKIEAGEPHYRPRIDVAPRRPAPHRHHPRQRQRPDRGGDRHLPGHHRPRLHPRAARAAGVLLARPRPPS